MSRARSRLVTAGWLVATPLAGVAAARVAGWDGHPFLSMANAGTPFVYLPAYGALAVGIATGDKGLTAAAGAVAAAHAVWTAPELKRPRPLPAGAATAPRLRLVTANIRFPRKDSTALGAELARTGADVLLLQELAPSHLAMIKEAGAFDAYPYSYVDERPGSFGAGIWSKFALSDGETWDAGDLPMVRATLDIEGAPVRIYNVHAKAPMRQRWIPIWKAQLAALRVEAEKDAARGPVILAGDFNSTYGHAPFRALLKGLLRDAHVDVGRGLGTTWPRGGRVMPPLFRIDHVLVSDGLAVLEVREGKGSGSDHRPVVADIAVTPAQGAPPAGR